MTIQTVNSFSMSFLQTGGNRVNTEKEQDFDSFLRADTQVTKAAAPVKPKQEATSITADSSEVVTDHSVKPQTEHITSKAKETVTTDDAVMTDTYVNMPAETDTAELPEEILAEILAVLNDFVTTLQNLLGADTEQLLDAAEQIQFGVTDFFDSNKIKELFLQVTGTDETLLLTDESLYKSFEHLQELLDGALQDLEVFGMIQQEGFDPNQFDLKAFEEQLTEFIRTGLQVDDVVQDVEKLVEFDVDAEKLNRIEFETTDTVVKTTAESDVADVQGSDMESGSEQQHSSGTERSFDQAGLFLQKLVDSVSRATEDVQNLPDSFGLFDIAAQIIEQVKIHIRPENTKMEMQLNPEQLGKVELEISSKNGELSAKLNVQNDQVKEAVESQMQILRETLEAQGLKVENIEVTVAEFGFRFHDESTGSGQQQQKRSHNTLIDFDDAESDEQSYSDVAEVMKELNGNTVDYVA